MKRRRGRPYLNLNGCLVVVFAILFCVLVWFMAWTWASDASVLHLSKGPQ